MRVCKVLYTSKTLADKSHPVMIRISHKSAKKYISTGQSCKPNHWSKSQGLVGAKDPNHEAKNKVITSCYLSLQNRLSQIKEQKVEPSIELLLSDKPIIDHDKGNLLHIFELKSKSCKAQRTKNEYMTFRNALQSLYGDYIDINEINQTWANNLRSKIDEYYGDKNAQKNHFIKCFTGAYSFAEEIGAVSFSKAIRIKGFHHEKIDRYLTTEDVSIILSAYKKDIVARSRILSDEQELALSLFILMVAFQGIANIDLAGVKVSDVNIKTIKKISVDWEQYHNDNEYKCNVDEKQDERAVVILTFNRRKTQRSVSIVADYISIKPILDKLLQNKRPNDYLIPCFSAKTMGNDKREIERCARFFNKYKRHLNEYLNYYCSIWDCPKIDNLTYYQARAAFANQVANMDISHNLIQKMLGQKQTVLEKHYLQPPTEWEQSEVSYKIFNKAKTVAELIDEGQQYSV